MNIEIILTEADLKTLVLKELKHRLGEVKLETSNVKIEVKSSQNYKAEWETGHYRAKIVIAQ